MSSAKMKVSIGSDHRGLKQRKVIAEAIEALGHEVDDQGTFTDASCDYPDVAETVANQVASQKSDLGILVCGTGIGMSIAANKVVGVRAALCCNVESAKLSRQHNDANILCLSGSDFDDSQYKAVVTSWLNSEFEGGRHARRVQKVRALESK